MATGDPARVITLATPLSFATSFRFPLQNALARREVLIGALLLVVLPGVGWVLNMGHRIQMVHNMQHGRPAWPAWRDPVALFRHGLVTLIGMIYWHAPGAVVMAVGDHLTLRSVMVLGGLLFVAGTVAVPGYMTHYCRDFAVKEVFSPLLAIRRIRGAGIAYWRAWSIAAAALVLSFVGMAGLGICFFVTSVWFWQVAGFSFASVFTQTYSLRTQA